MGSGCFYSMPGINNIEPIEFFRILRIAFIKPIGDLLIDLPIVYPFTYETFTPELVRQKDPGTGSSQRERLEKMKETFSKVIAFLRNSGRLAQLGHIRSICYVMSGRTIIDYHNYIEWVPGQFITIIQRLEWQLFDYYIGTIGLHDYHTQLVT